MRGRGAKHFFPSGSGLGSTFSLISNVTITRLYPARQGGANLRKRSLIFHLGHLHPCPYARLRQSGIIMIARIDPSGGESGTDQVVGLRNVFKKVPQNWSKN